jgi:amphiphysin
MHDEEISQKIPLIMDAISTFFTPILSTMYAVQSDLYQHLYASVHEYATSQGLTETDSVVEEFVERYEPKRQEAEGSIKSVREGKTGKTPYGEANISKPGIFARKSSGSSATVRSASSKTGGTGQPAPPPYTPDPTRTSSYSSYSRPSPSSVTSGSSTATLGNRPDSVSASDPAKQKRPPPPPPPKPSPSPKPEFVVAIYDFAGENAGDLSFRAGDRIKIIKKTNSLDDWWQGEVNGTQGSFPRNYCE